MPDIEHCTCPPERDVFRHPVYTREPCPIHPEPDLSGIKLMPAIRDLRISTDPIRLDGDDAS